MELRCLANPLFQRLTCFGRGGATGPIGTVGRAIPLAWFVDVRVLFGHHGSSSRTCRAKTVHQGYDNSLDAAIPLVSRDQSVRIVKERREVESDREVAVDGEEF